MFTCDTVPHVNCPLNSDSQPVSNAAHVGWGFYVMEVGKQLDRQARSATAKFKWCQTIMRAHIEMTYVCSACTGSHAMSSPDASTGNGAAFDDDDDNDVAVDGSALPTNVQLGIRGGTDALGTKLGGNARFLGRCTAAPPCARCGASSRLAAQLFAPTDDVAERYLYLFTCASTPDCQFWKLLRGQSKTPFVAAAPSAAATVSSPARGVGLGSWSVDALADDVDDLADILASGSAFAARPAAVAAASTTATKGKASSSARRAAEVLVTCMPEPAADNSHAAALLARYNKEAREQGEDTFESGRYEECVDDDDDDFALRLAREPRQLVRYAWASRPLLPEARMAPASVPACEACGSARAFEAQLMPAALDDVQRLTGSTVEWSTVLFYACATSCDAGVDEWCVVCNLV